MTNTYCINEIVTVQLRNVVHICIIVGKHSCLEATEIASLKKSLWNFVDGVWPRLPQFPALFIRQHKK
jgi:hypothetical protein